MKENLLGKNPEELKAVAVECGLKPFVGRQLSEWLYQKRVSSFGQMTNISNSAKEILAEKYSVGAVAPSGRAVSADGTVKYLFPVECGGEKSAVEAVVIPEDDRRTLCVSSQAGCKMDLSYFGKSLVKVCNDIVNVLYTD